MLFENYNYNDMRYVEIEGKKYILITFNDEKDAYFAYKEIQLTQLNGIKLFFIFLVCNEIDMILDINNDINYVKKILSSYWRNRDKFIICVFGPSGSGKTTLIGELKSFLKFNFSKLEIEEIHSDNYFKTKHCYFDKQLKTRNMEQKDACDYKSILNDIKSILNDINIINSKIILIEGLMLINSYQILNLCDILILFNCDNNICFQRRKSRKKRNNINAFTKYYNRYVYPQYKINCNYFWLNTIYKLNNHQLFININTTNYNSKQILFNIIKILFDSISISIKQNQINDKKHNCLLL